MAEVAVITTAVHAEGGKWERFADQVAPVKAAAERLTLDASAFFIGTAETAIHAQAYGSFQSYMVQVLGGAVVEFGQLGAALHKIADAYDRADAVVSLNLNEIYHE